MKELDRRELVLFALAGIGSSLALTACGGVAGGLGAIAPRFSVAGVRLLGLDFSGLTAGVDLDALNPNPINLPIDAIDLGLDLAGVRIGNGSLGQPVSLVPNQSTRVPLTVTSDLLSLGQNAQRFLSARNLPYEVKGAARVAGVPLAIPFAKTGILNIA
ncbi:MAG: LEA type 2 family protein [Alphaproteobacteria bacterium]